VNFRCKECNGLWRRLEDDFRTLIASGFEFPDVTFLLVEAGNRTEDSIGSTDFSTGSEQGLSDASDRTGFSSGGQLPGCNHNAIRGGHLQSLRPRSPHGRIAKRKGVIPITREILQLTSILI